LREPASRGQLLFDHRLQHRRRRHAAQRPAVHHHHRRPAQPELRGEDRVRVHLSACPLGVDGVGKAPKVEPQHLGILL
jgi:hypothetical protein